MQCTLLLGTLLLWEGGVLLGVFGLVVIPVVVGFFFAFFFFFPPPLAFLTADPQTALFPRLCSFHLRSWLSLRASFMQTNCSGTYIVRISLGHGRRTALAAFTETSWLVLPAQPPRAFCVRGHLCLLSLLCSGYGTCTVSPFQGEGKTTFSWRADE